MASSNWRKSSTDAKAASTAAVVGDSKATGKGPLNGGKAPKAPTRQLGAAAPAAAAAASTNAAPKNSSF